MKKMKTKGVVYSTELGRVCPGCGHPAQKCCCSKKKSQDFGDGIVRISRQTKGRKGAGVCIITGLPVDELTLKKIGQNLKKKCGTGGTIKNGVIEIQGDHRDLLVATLTQLGFKTKLAGG